jgi:uncharacterized protein (TIGR02147 family)
LENLRKGSEAVDFRQYLQSELLKRCKSNPRYSLRAFAKFLQLESSYLSKVLQGKRSVTESLLEKVRQPLGLDPNEVQRFQGQARQLRQMRSGNQALDAENAAALGEFHPLTLDAFHLISDWYHYAILELTTVDLFKSNPKWIARALDIPVPLVNNALERLLRLGLLKRSSENQQLKTTGNNTTVGNPFSAAAFRKLQQDVLRMALRALEEVPIAERDQSSVTLAIDIERLPEAKERIRNFRRAFAAQMQRSGTKNSVYQLGISFYPVSLRLNETKGESGE